MEGLAIHAHNCSVSTFLAAGWERGYELALLGAAKVEFLAFNTISPNADSHELDDMWAQWAEPPAEPLHNGFSIKFPHCRQAPMLFSSEDLHSSQSPTPAENFVVHAWNGANVFWFHVVAILKSTICQRTNVDPARIQLYYLQCDTKPFQPLQPVLKQVPNDELGSNKTLLDYGFHTRKELFVGYDNMPDLVDNAFFVKVRNSGKIIPIMGLLSSPSRQQLPCTVKRLKEMIYQSEGYPIYQQSLFLGFRSLQDNATLDKYGIRPQTVVELRPWNRAGAHRQFNSA